MRLLNQKAASVAAKWAVDHDYEIRQLKLFQRMVERGK